MPFSRHARRVSSARGLTRNESVVLGKLEAANAPLKAYELLDLTRADGLTAPMTIYRALNGLIGRGLVKKIALLNAFVIVGEAEERFLTAYLICKRCGRAFEHPIDAAFAQSALARTGFRIDEISIEVRGECDGACRDGAGGG